MHFNKQETAFPFVERFSPIYDILQIYTSDYNSFVMIYCISASVITFVSSAIALNFSTEGPASRGQYFLTNFFREIISMATAMFTRHNVVTGHTNWFRSHYFIRLRMFHDTILVDTGFVRECIRSDDGLLVVQTPRWRLRPFHLFSWSARCWRFVNTGKNLGRVRTDITTSSKLVFPARSPKPFIVTSTCLAPFWAPFNVFAVASPKSLWQWAEKTTSCEHFIPIPQG